MHSQQVQWVNFDACQVDCKSNLQQRGLRNETSLSYDIHLFLQAMFAFTEPDVKLGESPERRMIYFADIAAEATVSSVWATPAGVSAIATCGAALFALVALISLRFLKKQLMILGDQSALLGEQLKVLIKQIEGDHERSRRERTIDLMMSFNASLPPSPEHQYAVRLVYLLKKEQVEEVWKRRSFRVSADQQEMLDYFRAARAEGLQAKSKLVVSNGDRSEVSVAESTMLRAIAAAQLNKLEIIATAWHHNIADQQILETEFRRVFCPEEGSYVLSSFREVSTIYPSINAICAHFDALRRRSVPEAKAPIRIDLTSARGGFGGKLD